MSSLNILAIPQKRASARTAAVVALLMLAPYPIIWVGMNILRDAALTLALYHGLVLVPAIIWGFGEWRHHVRLPSFIQTSALIMASVGFCISSLWVYKQFGDILLSSELTFNLLVDMGYTNAIFWPLSIYFVAVNSVLEELFWRGVILNKLDKLCGGVRHAGIILSSLAYGAFHYPILQMVMYPGWAEIGFAFLVIYGALLAVLYKRTNSIVLPSLAHALLTDLSAIVLLLALFQRLNIH